MDSIVGAVVNQRPHLELEMPEMAWYQTQAVFRYLQRQPFHKVVAAKPSVDFGSIVKSAMPWWISTMVTWVDIYDMMVAMISKTSSKLTRKEKSGGTRWKMRGLVREYMLSSTEPGTLQQYEKFERAWRRKTLFYRCCHDPLLQKVFFL